MIESENLRTASLYINNQLLSRGLLRDGQNIDFANPGDTGGELAATMGRVMSVVNDLILRRDRDAEHRESLSTTLRALRAESLRQANDIQQLRDKQADAQRKVSLGEAAEATLRAQLRAAEAGVQRLKEEAARTKVLVVQTRSACANEVRKRDRQIDGLKKAVSEAGRARGATKNSGITTISVTGEVGGELDHGTPRGGTATDGYNLRMETNAFLAELAKGLSEENESLIGLLRGTNQRLKEMSGWDKQEAACLMTDGHALALPGSPEEMADEIDSVLDHLRTILTNPSFVPIEEVVMREEEIARLREGWMQMESRWKEAVHLIDGWRRRMQLDGRPVNMEELKMGLRLSPVRVRDVEETALGLGLRLPAVQEEAEELSILQTPTPADSLHLVPAPEYEDEDMSDAESSVFEDDVDVVDYDVEEPNVQILQQSTMLDSPPLPSPPQLSPLRDSYSAGNRGAAAPPKRSRPGDFTTIVEENTWEMVAKGPSPPEQLTKPEPAKRQQPLPTRPAEDDEMPPPPADMPASKDSSPESVMLVTHAEDSHPKPSTAATTRTQQRPTWKQQNRSEPTPASRRPARPPPRSASTRSKQSDGEQPLQTTSATTTTTTATAKPSRTPSSSSSSRSNSSMATTSSSTTTATTTNTTSNNYNNNKSTDLPPPQPTTTTTTTTTTTNRSPRRANSRLPLPRSGTAAAPQQQQQPQSPLTMASIAAKLAASEREADAARVRAKLRAARLGRAIGAGALAPTAAPPSAAAAATTTTSSVGSGGAREEEEEEEEDEREEGKEPVKRDVDAMASRGGGVEAGGGGAAMEEEEGARSSQTLSSPEKPRKRARRTNKAASRRRSTLNPRELESLIMGSVDVVATPGR